MSAISGSCNAQPLIVDELRGETGLSVGRDIVRAARSIKDGSATVGYGKIAQGFKTGAHD